MVAGRVQGVGYRYFFSQYAERRDLKGWIRNNPDGRVEVMLQGSAQELEIAEEILRKGPPAAQVDQVMVLEIEDEPVLGRFRLKY